MAKSFMDKYTDPKLIADMARTSGIAGDALCILAVIFAILGIIADAINGTLGLQAMSWFLLAIAVFLAGISWYLSWAVAVYFRSVGAKEKE